LHRPLLPALAAAVRPGGFLVYKTFTSERTASGGPRRPEHLLRPGELPAAFAQMRVIRYEEDAHAGYAALLAQRLS